MDNKPDFNFIIANSDEEFSAGKELFIEYSKTLDFDLCFQNFEKELSEIEIQYNKPSGGLILIKHNLSFAGCVGIRRFSDDIAELKRMYINPEFRGLKLGKELLKTALNLSKELGYQRIRLDTLNSMKAAVHLYKNFGFKEIEPYRYNPAGEVLFLEKLL